MTGADGEPRRSNGDLDTKMAFPELPVAVRAGVKFRVKVVTPLVQDHDLRQFLGLGTGLPAGVFLSSLLH